MFRAAVKTSTVALAFLCASHAPLAAQKFDKHRGSGAGCIHGERPPNSPIATAKGLGIIRAFYVTPTTEYRHGILGDAIEAKALTVRYNRDNRSFCDGIGAGENRVFEDTSPRIVDLDGDGLGEVIVVASHRDFGARLEAYGYPAPGEDITLLAHTPYIGRSNRWLAPIGAADLDGDGHVEVAFVDRPHLAKTIRLWRFQDGELVPVADLPGYTNHRIGEPDIAGGIRRCSGPPEMIVATADWSRLAAVRFDGTVFQVQDRGAHAGRASFAKALRC